MSIDRFTKAEFEAALPVIADGHPRAGEKLWRETGLVENEFTYEMEVSATGRIFIRSSVRPDGLAAETGADSIRCWLARPDGTPLGNKIQSHISRVTGWQGRMKEILRELWKRHVVAGDCPRCGQAMGIWKVKKSGPNTGRLFAKCPEHGHFFWLDDGKPKPAPKKETKKMPAVDLDTVVSDLECHGKIKDKLAYLRAVIEKKDEYTLFALTFIYDRQTEDEKQSEDTRWENTVGFSGVDAEILSSFAKQYIARGTLSEKQMALAKKKMSKYAKQILDIIRDKR